MKPAIATFATAILLAACFAHAAAPVNAVMYVGGGFHDYKTMPGVLTASMSKIANITFEIKPVATA